MQYLKGYTKARLLGISHETYCTSCVDYNINNVTKYSYRLIQHPVNSEYALEISDKTHLPELPFWNQLVSKEVMETDGWFNEVSE
jgi:hypothetical protein